MLLCKAASACGVPRGFVAFLSGCALEPLLVSEICFFSLKILKEFTWPLGDCVFMYTRPQVNTQMMFSGIQTSGSFWAWVILTRGGNIPGAHP